MKCGGDPTTSARGRGVPRVPASAARAWEGVRGAARSVPPDSSFSAKTFVSFALLKQCFNRKFLSILQVNFKIFRTLCLASRIQ